MKKYVQGRVKKEQIIAESLQRNIIREEGVSLKE